MPKNVVVCCDGTANEFARHRTNVVKLFFTLVKDPKEQVAFYHPGIGTMEPEGANSPVRRRVVILLERAFGYGLEYDIRDAYVFLMNHFEPGDRLFMFGFSRGAYTVRAVAALLYMYGLINKGNEPLVPYAIRMMMGINRIQEKSPQGEATANDKSADEFFSLADEFKQHFSGARCAPHFVGLWDTVSSVGWIENLVRLAYSANNPDIQIGRHAVAIDERRAFFRSNLWHPREPHPGPRDLKQVWFPGVHGDVGGGYPEAESGLSKITLEWMLREARRAGLMTLDDKVDLILGRSSDDYAKPCATAQMHESLTPVWWPAEFIPKRHYNWAAETDERRANLFRRRTIPANSCAHKAALERGSDYCSRLPTDVKFVD
jgi:uncharacterized protein (DUF2235 family)